MTYPLWKQENANPTSLFQDCTFSRSPTAKCARISRVGTNCCVYSIMDHECDQAGLRKNNHLGFSMQVHDDLTWVDGKTKKSADRHSPIAHANSRTKRPFADNLGHFIAATSFPEPMCRDPLGRQQYDKSATVLPIKSHILWIDKYIGDL